MMTSSSSSSIQTNITESSIVVFYTNTDCDKYVCTSCYTILDKGKKIVAFPELGHFTCCQCYNIERVKFIIDRFLLCQNIYSEYFIKDIYDVIFSFILDVISVVKMIKETGFLKLLKNTGD